MDSIITQVKQLRVVDDAGRKDLIIQLRDLASSLESTDDTMERILYLHLQIAGVRTAIDLKLFDQLEASDEPLTLSQLAQTTGADPMLLGRLLRYLSSVGIIKETGKDQFTATNVTEALAIPGNQAGVRHLFDTVGPIYQEMPKCLKKMQYQKIIDANKTVFHDAWKTEEPVFIWYPKHPEMFAYFNEYMAWRRGGMITWLDVYPVEQETKGWDPEAPIFVDMGGGIGHHCAELKASYPQLLGMFILQDLPHYIEQAKLTAGVTNMVHDISEPQPVKGARYYHLRGVLHDFPDKECRVILSNIVEAMGKNSSILIEEMVLPSSGVHWQTTQVDLTIMCAFAAVERTEDQWRALLDSVGLKIERVLVHKPSVHESTIVAIPK